jgi:hypothetical protein
MHSHGVRRVILIAIALLVLEASPAHANVGVPIVFGVWSVMVVALIPIIIIESVILWYVTAVGILKSLWTTSVANLVSTAIGIPLAGSWSLFTPAGWIYEKGERYEGERTWEVPAMILALLVPCFLVSWQVELGVIERLLGQPITQIHDRGVLIGNAVSYGLLVLVTVGLIMWSLHHRLVGWRKARAQLGMYRRPAEWRRKDWSTMSRIAERKLSPSEIRERFARLSYIEQQIREQPVGIAVEIAPSHRSGESDARAEAA